MQYNITAILEQAPSTWAATRWQHAAPWLHHLACLPLLQLLLPFQSAPAWLQVLLPLLCLWSPFAAEPLPEPLPAVLLSSLSTGMQRMH